MKRSHYIIGGLALAMSMPSSLQAQTTQPKDTTMTRTVVVEQEYNPDIMDASKVNVLPKVEEPTVSKKEVEYATTFFPATSVPAGLMRPYTGKEVQPGTTPGYVRAGYGNYGNLDILANYLFRLSHGEIICRGSNLMLGYYKNAEATSQIIDVWGVSQKTIREIISPEGTVQIENLGPVYLSGKTVKAVSYTHLDVYKRQL